MLHLVALDAAGTVPSSNYVFHIYYDYKPFARGTEDRLRECLRNGSGTFITRFVGHFLDVKRDQLRVSLWSGK